MNNTPWHLLVLIFLLGFTALQCAETKTVEKKAIKQETSTNVQPNTNNNENLLKKLNSFIEVDVQKWIHDPVLLSAIQAKNVLIDKVSDDQITQQDKDWIQSKDSDPIIVGYLSNACSNFLREVQKKSGSAYAEIFVMDKKGCIVGMSNRTSDYWQGDEDKFKKSFGQGHQAKFIDAVKFDESTQSNLCQASFTISDPTTNQPIGAITVGINVDKL